MTQTVVVEPGGIRQVPRIFKWLNARSVFLVTGKASFRASGAESVLAGMASQVDVRRFNDFEPNPQLEDAERGLALFRKRRCDAMLAVGGGSAIDMAKLIACFASQDAAPADIVTGAAPVGEVRLPLVAVPTTAGTGSEATHFAVVYQDGRKYSVAHPSLLPAIAVVDPDLTAACSPRLTAVSGLDALSQAVESWWCVNATAESQRDACTAMRLVLDHLADCVHRPTAKSRQAVSRAAYLAGRAINVTKTTAPHAISYTMTSHFNVPHGLAVALTLGETLVFNSEVTDADVTDPRGADHVRNSIDELNRLLGCRDARESRARLQNFLRDLGLESRLSEVGIRSDGERDFIAGNVNVERLANNPRRLNQQQLRDLLKRAA